MLGEIKIYCAPRLRIVEVDVPPITRLATRLKAITNDTTLARPILIITNK